ncbi:MAG: FAD-dependent monooxygenase [Telmatospirillum sp.]|nr:FAD-dependent monooxygenase [Telmatospirillum sp.]
MPSPGIQMKRRPRIAIAGAGVAGALLAGLLKDCPGLDVAVYERVGEDDHSQSGTGLNVGPNALKALAKACPDLERTIRAESFTWARWTVALVDGTNLMDLDLASVADNPGIRIRWSQLYRILRAHAAATIRYRRSIATAVPHEDGVALRVVDAQSGAETAHDDVDLLVVAEGRFSPLRDELFGPMATTYVGAATFRVLIDGIADPASCPIGDYGQWFNGPNRILAFQVPGNAVYGSGSFPLGIDAKLTDDLKQPDFLRALYTPPSGTLCPSVAFMVDHIVRNTDRIHWARLQEGELVYAHPSRRVLALGDAAHPMVPTLGQGATQAVEDACATAHAILAALRDARPLVEVPEEIAALRTARVRSCMAFSRQASDTMLAGSDPVEGTRWKTQPEFLARLSQLYRDVAFQ